MQDFFKNIPESQKQVVKSVAPLLLILFLFIFVGKLGVAQIKSVRAKIVESKKIQSILSEKLKILTSVSSTAASGIGWMLYALPGSNPSLQVMSQLKFLATMNALVLENVKCSASVEKGGVDYITTTFKVSGPNEGISAFAKGLEQIAPLTFMDKIKLNQAADISSAEVTVKTFWAPVPTTIPTVTSAVSGLTTSEQNLINEISKLYMPSFNANMSTSSAGANTSPFGE